jgi:hypothetical protein
MTMIGRAFVAFGLLGTMAWAVACSSSTTSSAEDAGTADAGVVTVTGPTTPGDPTVLAGTFQIKVVAPVAAIGNNPASAGSATFVGKLYDGPSPSDIIWETSATEGSCKLVTPKVPFCSTPCGGSKACVADDTCQAYPTAKSAGVVTVRGLKTEAGASEIVMSPVANAYQAPAGTKLAYPPFAEGDAVTLSAKGDYFVPFELASKGVLPLELGTDVPKLESGKALTVGYKAGAAGLAKIVATLDISHHGGTKGKIECESDDTGSLVIAAPLVTKLLALGVAGFPTIVVSRTVKAQTVVSSGRVELSISSVGERTVEVPGIVSCTDTTQCPNGQTCQADLTCK